MEDQLAIYDVANAFGEKTSRAVFLTGKAGTGKTTFLKNLREHTHKQMAVVAPTGVAAINAGGVTLHSFFQLPLSPFAPTEMGKRELIRKMKITKIRRKVLQQLELLIIDEISMVRADVLDAVDTILRHYRFRRDEPYGGVQVIYIGDLYQLPPVVVPEEWALIAPYYRSPFFFDSHVVQEQPPVYIELDKIFRQKNADFIQLLNEVRNDRLTPSGLRMLQDRYDPDFKLTEHPEYIFLTTHNANANRINNEELKKLRGKSKKYEAVVQGDFPEKNFPNDPTLELKVGAKVMFITNDKNYPKRYFNGKIGTVTALDEKEIIVYCIGDEENIKVTRETWENVKYNVNKQNGVIEENTIGTYVHFPLRLAWAITIHKSQGLTFEKAIIDAAYSFSAGQVYVALSRCRSLEGIVLNSPIRMESLAVERAVVDYSQQKLPTSQLQLELQKSEDAFKEQLLQNIFDFRFMVGQTVHLQNFVKRNEEHFNDDGKVHADRLHTVAAELADVASRFRSQIHAIYADDPQRLPKRIKAAAGYFKVRLRELMEQSSTTPAEIYNFDVAKDYKEEMKTLYTEIALRRHLITSLKKDYDSETLYILRDKFKVPTFKLKTVDTFEEAERLRTKREEKEERKGRRKKDEKEETPSYRISYELYKEGHTVEEIASERALALSTIENHLARCVNEGILSLDEFVPAEFQQAVRELSENGATTGEIFSALEGNVSYAQILAVIGGN